MTDDTKLRSELMLHRLDELFVQQHVVRRFKLNHVGEFRILESLRNELEVALLKFSPDLPENPSLSRQIRTCQLSQCINHFDVKENLVLFATGTRKAAYSNFIDNLHPYANTFDSMPIISRLLIDDDEACSNLFEILLRYAEPILEIDENLNFFDYYNPLAMTSLVEGADIYLSYVKAKAGIDTLRPGVNSKTAAFLEARWLFTLGSAIDDDLSSLVHTYCYRPSKPSRNIKIIGGEQHTVTINDLTIDNCLFLCVPTNQIPDKIDESLRYFRDALVAELGAYFPASQQNRRLFEDSRFMTHFSRFPLLVKNWDQVQKNIVGLWVWDKINFEGVKIKSAYQKIGAYEQIGQEMKTLKHDFKHEFDFYSENTIKTYSEDTASLIGSVNSKNKHSVRALDKFVTGENIRLGKRDIH